MKLRRRDYLLLFFLLLLRRRRRLFNLRLYLYSGINQVVTKLLFLEDSVYGDAFLPQSFHVIDPISGGVFLVDTTEGKDHSGKSLNLQGQEHSLPRLQHQERCEELSHPPMSHEFSSSAKRQTENATTLNLPLDSHFSQLVAYYGGDHRPTPLTWATEKKSGVYLATPRYLETPLENPLLCRLRDAKSHNTGKQQEEEAQLSKILVPGDSSINGTSFARVMIIISSNSSSILGFSLIALLILSNSFGLRFLNALRGNTRRR
uniref:Transmembrane protein n=1 Tax=Salix viminalis TaxID=40686 RepID=A0A6N2M470_SALVM